MLGVLEMHFPLYRKGAVDRWQLLKCTNLFGGIFGLVLEGDWARHFILTWQYCLRETDLLRHNNKSHVHLRVTAKFPKAKCFFYKALNVRIKCNKTVSNKRE